MHTCTLEEIAGRFGRFERSTRRQRLTEALERYVNEVRALGVADALIIDGSYVTTKPEPNDIDMILVLRNELQLGKESTPAEYNVGSTRIVRRRFGFDVLTVVQDSARYVEYMELFSRIRRADPDLRTGQANKGVLRIQL